MPTWSENSICSSAGAEATQEFFSNGKPSEAKFNRLTTAQRDSLKQAFVGDTDNIASRIISRTADSAGPYKVKVYGTNTKTDGGRVQVGLTYEASAKGSDGGSIMSSAYHSCNLDGTGPQ